MDRNEIWEKLYKELELLFGYKIEEEKVKSLYFIYIAYEVAASDGLAEGESDEIEKQMKDLIDQENFVQICNIFYDSLKEISNKEIINLSKYLFTSFDSENKKRIIRSIVDIVAGDHKISTHEKKRLVYHLPEDIAKIIELSWEKETGEHTKEK